MDDLYVLCSPTEMHFICAVIAKKNYLPRNGFDSDTYLLFVYFSKNRKYVRHPAPGARLPCTPLTIPKGVEMLERIAAGMSFVYIRIQLTRAFDIRIVLQF